uniref:Decaprenyl-diphosphate synthase subunit 1 n=1 Tax=Romanomermis culicivorax TaxID=13658 RepID=A0A915HJL1_ROMCU
MQLVEQNEAEELRNLSRYCFLEGGKMIRPTVVLLMAGCCSSFSRHEIPISVSQNKVAVVSEMIHTASLVHDDVIDESNERRNRPTVSSMAGNKSAILVGDYILAKATQLLTTIGDADVIALLAQVIEDLVKGEFMQLGSRASEDERFMHYMMKTFKKTASLFAHSCKAVAKLAGCDEYSANMAYEFGKNLGIAFQLIDDTLDFVVRSSEVGKPTFVDLKLGIATAPILFASRQHSQLNDLILRRFSKNGDVDLAYNLILESDGLLRSRQLAEQYCKNAVDNLAQFPNSEFKTALVAITSAQCSRSR